MIEEEKLTESLFEAPKIDQQERMVEAILFAAQIRLQLKKLLAVYRMAVNQKRRSKI